MAEDWEYSQRWEIQKVYDNIFISSFKPARDRKVLESFKITAILILKDEKETFVKENFDDFNNFTVLLENSVYTNLLPVLKITNEFIQSQVSMNRNVLVHCLGGISRAPAVVVGYLINQGMSFDQAYQTVQVGDELNVRWCGPCKALSPRLEQLSTTHTSTQFLKVDVDKHQDLAKEYGVQAMPTVVFIKGNKEVGRVVGMDMAKINQLLQSGKVIGYPPYVTKQNPTNRGSSSSSFQGTGQTLSGKKSVASQPKQQDSTVMFVIIGLLLAYLYLTKESAV